MSSSSPPELPEQATNTLSHIVRSIFSYDGNIMLAAVISLLLVILFVLLLHVYAKWFLAQAQQRRRRSMTVSHALRPSRFHHFHTFNLDTSVPSPPTKGLDASLITTIPLFLYSSAEHKNGLECVICLSPFEENEMGRDLPKCHHGFHVECIDTWLSSHTNCPICRAPVVCEAKVVTVGSEANAGTDSAVDSSEGVGIELGTVGSDGDSAMEFVIDIPGCENQSDQNAVMGDSVSVTSSSSSSLSCSLKRMLSRNRSSERKVFPSSNMNDVNV
ncbi:hypothetical protein F2P56_010926 [Juglans regia]|uniref:RING-type E3 ubiquitin transferase n=2 Tax=Juglans regia TaxID=51240 RepID=A0A833XNN5_JUGRE|nr:RING-H2 finger protein ATL63-like [Juglans regia]KAF5470408.1 hypothetical protein F2P56_010926 [Juglans regia]